MGCRSELELATWSCRVPKYGTAIQAAGNAGTAGVVGGAGSAGAAGATELAGAAGSSSSGELTETFDLPWVTGFENGTCDYEDGRGGFVTTGSALPVAIVTEPVHSGGFSAAFTITDPSTNGQVRGIRKGVLPTAAVYGAWYYFPSAQFKVGDETVWNLFHFQGDNSFKRGHLWDISLRNKDNGDLRLEVFTYMSIDLPNQDNNPSIPIGSWVHIEMYWKRAKDKSGEVIVYQNGEEFLHLKDITSDNSTETAEWYVGNFVDKLESVQSAQSTVYLDDVSISLTSTSPRIKR